MQDVEIKRARPVATLIASEEPLRREGMTTLLRQCAPVEIIAECDGSEALLHKTEALSPALILLDFEIPGSDPVQLISRIKKCSAAKIVIVTGVKDENTVCDAIKAGANGYLFRKCSSLEFRQAIAEVLRGRLYIAGSSEAGSAEAFQCPFHPASYGEMESTDSGTPLANLIEDAILQRLRAVAGELETRLEETHRQSIESCFESVQNTMDLRIAALTREIARNGEALARLGEPGVGG